MLHKLIINPKYKNFEKYLLNIKNIFNDADNSIHKARNELKIIELNNLKCVVKSFKIPHVNTPEPIGIIEFFNQGLLSESYFISIYEPYDFTIREVFHHKADNYQEILKQFTKFTYETHQKGVWHVDYSLGNILITKKDDLYKFSLVDINRMEFKTISGYEGLKNFNKFWAKDDNDLLTIAKEYAKLASLDETKAIKIVFDEAKGLEAKVSLKRQLKKYT